MTFNSEEDLRVWLLKELRKRLPATSVVLDSKNVSDVIVCANTRNGPAALFVEVKYLTDRSGRIGIGDWEGKGFQPEILSKRPRYFELYTRWLIAAEDGWAVLADNETVRAHVSGGAIETGKQTNIKESIFDDNCFRVGESPERIAAWIESLA